MTWLQLTMSDFLKLERHSSPKSQLLVDQWMISMLQRTPLVYDVDMFAEWVGFRRARARPKKLPTAVLDRRILQSLPQLPVQSIMHSHSLKICMPFLCSLRSARV